MGVIQVSRRPNSRKRWRAIFHLNFLFSLSFTLAPLWGLSWHKCIKGCPYAWGFWDLWWNQLWKKLWCNWCGDIKNGCRLCCRHLVDICQAVRNIRSKRSIALGRATALGWPSSESAVAIPVIPVATTQCPRHGIHLSRISRKINYAIRLLEFCHHLLVEL